MSDIAIIVLTSNNTNEEINRQTNLANLLITKLIWGGISKDDIYPVLSPNSYEPLRSVIQKLREDPPEKLVISYQGHGSKQCVMSIYDQGHSVWAPSVENLEKLIEELGIPDTYFFADSCFGGKPVNNAVVIGPAGISSGSRMTSELVTSLHRFISSKKGNIVDYLESCAYLELAGQCLNKSKKDIKVSYTDGLVETIPGKAKGGVVRVYDSREGKRPNSNFRITLTTALNFVRHASYI